MTNMKRFVLLTVVVLSPVLMGAGSCLSPAAPSEDTPLAHCSRAGLFYCNAHGGPQTLQAFGWTGWCALPGNAGNYSTGYSGYNGPAGTPAYSTSGQAWSDCGSTGPTSRGWCLGVITCSRN